MFYKPFIFVVDVAHDGISPETDKRSIELPVDDSSQFWEFAWANFGVEITNYDLVKGTIFSVELLQIHIEIFDFFFFFFVD
ncbi:hypothetical protein NECAME_10558 [Necator americanus]|uniref:Uncharacterized protein n=1 Tax=Necator americanus TaxID=51031 RepID=W2T7Y6_NECAM|nr:hypothetical protein NECAME_10558 [Necator americanus]ETN78135.1 hypothetical protein NECAME_10558 [Necator americanus]